MIYHQASGERRATLWLRQKGEEEFKVLRVAGQIRFFPSIYAAITYVSCFPSHALYDEYQVIVWTPQFYGGGNIPYTGRK